MNCYLTEIVNTMHYPEEILQLRLGNITTGSILDSTTVWDLDNGTLLSVTADCYIVQAVFGYEILS